jgi:hypothetical protein
MNQQPNRHLCLIDALLFEIAGDYPTVCRKRVPMANYSEYTFNPVETTCNDCLVKAAEVLTDI